MLGEVWVDHRAGHVKNDQVSKASSKWFLGLCLGFRAACCLEDMDTFRGPEELLLGEYFVIQGKSLLLWHDIVKWQRSLWRAEQGAQPTG
jgi:hypothetical protein